MKVVIMAANIGKDAEWKDASNGNGVNVFFSVCENTREKINGEMTEVANWYSCIYHAASANVAQYLKKGAKVCIIGDLTIDTYTSDKTGRVQVSRNVFVADLKIVSFVQAVAPGVDPVTGEVKQAPNDAQDLPY
jgi:single stranded DNA-binding protein